MAELLRSAKSAHLWTSHDLDAYRIRFVQANTLDFFGVNNLPAATVHPRILHNLEDAGQNPPEAVLDFLSLLQAVPTGPDALPVYGSESLTDDFSNHLLKSFMAFPPNLKLVVHQNLRRGFFMSGKRVWGTADVEISSVAGQIFLVQENKVRFSSLFPQPHP
jgi:hypothetical protein